MQDRFDRIACVHLHPRKPAQELGILKLSHTGPSQRSNKGSSAHMESRKALMARSVLDIMNTITKTSSRYRASMPRTGDTRKGVSATRASTFHLKGDVHPGRHVDEEKERLDGVSLDELAG